MFPTLFKRRGDPHTLAVSMTGVKMGDRVAFVGCANGARLAAIAAKVGLSGSAVAIAPDRAAAERVQRGAADAGVLVDVEIAPPTHLPLDTGGVDVAIVDNSDGLLARFSADDVHTIGNELTRILRAGGRAVIVGAGPKRGLGALGKKPRATATPNAAGATTLLESAGLKSVRVLAEREGLSLSKASSLVPPT